MRDGLIIHDDADKTPAPPPGRHPLAPISGAEFERPRRRLPPQAWLIITVAALAPVVALLIAVWRGLEDLFARQPWLPDALLTLVLLGALLLLGSGVAGALGWGRARLLHARVIRTAHGAPVDVGAALGVHPLVAEQQQLALYHAQAPYALHPNLSTLSYGGKQAEKVEAPALPEPGPDVTPIAPAVWLAWLDRVPHVMLAAETGGGKTTMATHILATRLTAGETCFIIDPNASGWGGLPSVGGGEDWPAVRGAMEAVISLYIERQQARQQHLQRTRTELAHDAFERLTVVLDEAFMAKEALDTGKGSIWQRFVPILGSGARKVGISVILLTQTANVDDLKISGPLRENYTRIALDSGAATKLIQREEPDRVRKAALLAALAGVAFPAVTERKGQVVMLDRSGLAQMPNLDRYTDRVWQPLPCQMVAPEDTLLKALRRAKYEKRWTRDQAREAGLRFENELWGQV